jgi:deoxyadenosine/deoxycytidine kinase
MSTENTTDKKSWYAKLTERFEALMKKFDMPEDIRIELENFVFGVAKEQYLNGNKSGISWLRRQVGAKPGQILAAIDAPPTTA